MGMQWLTVLSFNTGGGKVSGLLSASETGRLRAILDGGL